MKRLLILTVCCIAVAACTERTTALYALGQPPDITFPIRYVVIPESPQPGEPVTIAINTLVSEALLFVNERQLARSAFFYVVPDNNRHKFMTAIITVPSTVDTNEEEPVIAVIRINYEHGTLTEIIITLAHREFRSETLHLTPSLTTLVSTPTPQRTLEAQRFWEILGTTNNYVYHWGNFVLPVASTRRTSHFGTRRVNQFSDGRRGAPWIHAGIDFGIPIGTEVWASGRGRVILSRYRIISGYSVILEHAPGVYSVYYHLDSLIAEEGEIVEAGQLIGLSGNTGFSTGPHLHWEVRVSSENTDPDAFVRRPLIDKDLIISKLFR